MEKTPFAGITALGPNESIYSDNSAFIDRDRFEIDRELKLGVKTHRHTGLGGLSAPLAAPSGLVIGSGGAIPGGLSLTLGITYLDLDGGETLIGPTNLVTTPSPVQAPTVQLAAEIEYTAGSLDVDTFTYAFTHIDSGGGETPLGPAVVVARQPGFANAQVVISGQAPGGWPDPSIVGARLYRARAGGEYVFLAEVDEEPFTDDGAVSPDCDRHPPSFNINTTGGANQITVTIPENPTPVEGEVELAFFNLYCSQSGSFDESCLVGRFPTGSAGGTIQVLSLDLLDGQPPDVNLSKGGASQIDPDTELLDWHWKRPVADESKLPESAEEGDARVVLADESIWVFNGTEWKQASAGGGSLAVTDGTTTVAEADDLRFAAGSGISVAVTEPVGGEALLTIAATGPTSGAMGVVWCGEDLTLARPSGFDSVTWITQGKGEEEPEHMKVHDLLWALP